MMNQKPIIEIEDLQTYYGNVHVLKGINLSIYENETLAILGRSGCGKSTLLRHMIGLYRPSSGKIWVKGHDITQLNEDEKVEVLKRIGMLFQNAALFNSMSLADNVSLPLREHTDLEESTIRIMTRMKLDLVGLSGFESFNPSQLSGGMKKRAGLARAIAMDPEILFCDEPSAGLDPIVAAGIDKLLLKLKQAFKMTTVIVTHEMASVFLIADRIAVMNEGQILAIGTKAEIEKNQHPFIQQFLRREPDSEVIDRDSFLKTLTSEISD
jgi:phospholipid/cholesterol/gamma-HCH transport system ATP-binding protein